MSEHDIEKWIWDEKDYERMGWHDATIHAMAFRPEIYEFWLDMDYIFEWIHPSENETYYRFQVSPVTLVFENVDELAIDIEVFDSVQLQDVIRGQSRRPRNAEHIMREIEWRWTIDTNVGEITLWAAGYKQYVRQRPLLVKSQELTLEQRGNISFEHGNF